MTRSFLDSDEIIYLKSNHLSLTQARNRDMLGNLFIENRFYLYLQQPKLLGHIFTGLLLHSRIETYLSSKLFKESHKNLAPYLLTKMNELLALPEERSSFVIAAHVQVLRASGVEEMDKMSPAQLMLPQLLSVTNQQTSPQSYMMESFRTLHKWVYFEVDYL